MNRIKEGAIALNLNESVEKASPKFVREAPGFAVGGLAAGGHAQCLTITIERGLLGLDVFWVASGNPGALIRIEPQHLVQFMC